MLQDGNDVSEDTDANNTEGGPFQQVSVLRFLMLEQGVIPWVNCVLSVSRTVPCAVDG